MTHAGDPTGVLAKFEVLRKPESQEASPGEALPVGRWNLLVLEVKLKPALDL